MSNKVSIILPCYNQAHWLTDAVVSCIEQTVKPHEIIIVNDGSNDSTFNVANSLVLQYSDYNIKLITKENGGLSSARNAGIKIATGDYICCLDSDDKLASNYIEKTLEADDDIVGFSYQEFGDKDGIFPPPFKHPKLEHFRILNCIICSALFKREIWEKVGGYDEDMRLGYEDHDFWMRALIAGYEVTCVKEILYYYRKHGKSLVSVAIENHQAIRDYMNSKY